MPLNENDKDIIHATFLVDCRAFGVLHIVPHAAPSTPYRMRSNVKVFGQVRKPSPDIKRMGPARKITPIMRKFFMGLLSHRSDL